MLIYSKKHFQSERYILYGKGTAYIVARLDCVHENHPERPVNPLPKIMSMV
jgi:hypothetical protein